MFLTLWVLICMALVVLQLPPHPPHDLKDPQ